MEQNDTKKDFRKIIKAIYEKGNGSCFNELVTTINNKIKDMDARLNELKKITKGYNESAENLQTNINDIRKENNDLTKPLKEELKNNLIKTLKLWVYL